MITVKGPIHFKVGQPIPANVQKAVIDSGMLPFKKAKKLTKNSLKGKLRKS